MISNSNWRNVFTALTRGCDEHYIEKIGFSYSFNPVTDHIFSQTSTIFDLKKAAAMYFWYKNGDRNDHSIIEYFEEYKRCIDETHPTFNSNYGYYAYTENLLNKCVVRLLRDKDTRQACFCINNNEAMDSIDKLCTNAIHFFIRGCSLKVVVQMRSSNFITLLPYDAFMFSVFYAEVYKKLKACYKWLKTDDITMQVATLHLYKSDLDKIKPCKMIVSSSIIDFEGDDNNKSLENYLLTALQILTALQN